jgi:hypothetical protein
MNLISRLHRMSFSTFLRNELLEIFFVDTVQGGEIWKDFFDIGDRLCGNLEDFVDVE